MVKTMTPTHLMITLKVFMNQWKIGRDIEAWVVIDKSFYRNLYGHVMLTDICLVIVHSQPRCSSVFNWLGVMILYLKPYFICIIDCVHLQIVLL